MIFYTLAIVYQDTVTTLYYDTIHALVFTREGRDLCCSIHIFPLGLFWDEDNWLGSLKDGWLVVRHRQEPAGLGSGHLPPSS